MQLLVYNGSIIDIGMGHFYSYAFYDNDCAKWAVYGKGNNLCFYALDPNRQAQTADECEFKVVEVPDGEYPGDGHHTEAKYRYKDGHLVENPDWVEPLAPMGDIGLEGLVRQQGEEILALSSYSADMLYMVCLMQLGITDDSLEGGEGEDGV